MTRLTDIEYMYHTVPRICLLIVNTLRSFPHSSLNIGFVFKVIRQVPPVEKELLTFPEHTSSPQVFSGVRVAQSLICCVVFCGSLSFCTFSFSHCVVVCFVILSFFFWSLCCCLLIFDLWNLNTLYHSPYLIA